MSDGADGGWGRGAGGRVTARGAAVIAAVITAALAGCAGAPPAARTAPVTAPLTAGLAAERGAAIPSPAGSGPAVPAAAVEALVAPLVAARRFSGAIVLMRDGRVVYEGGFGLASHDPPRPFTPRTPSDGGSLAKTFTAAGLWWLVQEGRLSLSAPVRSLVPEYPHAGVTVGDLIAHSNGLAPDYGAFDPYFQPGQARTTSQLLALAGRLAPEPGFAPGTRFEYTNLGYDAAGRVIEVVSGQRYADFVRERFFRPHGLVDSFARPAHFAGWPVPRTVGMRWRDGRWQPHDAYDDEAFLGASNLIFSAADLARWGDAWTRGAVLPAAAERAGREPPRIDGRPSAIDGLSWYCAEGRRRCHYTGSLNAFHALVHWDRGRRETVALVANAAVPPWALLALQRGLVDLLEGRTAPPVPPEHPALLALDDAGRAAMAGRWALPGLGVLALQPGGPGLQVRLDDGLWLDAHPVSRQVLYVPGADWWLAFEGEAPSGARLRLRGMHHDTVGTRSP